ncbi:GntR family transcriptional regulator [Biostraticola tofi]|uniref:DNA-binding GntR family transcriptional regulator n=1 Tax=Biostraticola tofi TaxID=466109 RepID=A0A4R3YN80_9GAMM|nr:GntR family transcriptional regulator [Biostraticola tofi]TCV92978.1 DNA-binding GntR family transcriptional regulator [Biostraticola tofi]
MAIAYTITASEPVNQQIYRFLRREIVTCEIPPGALLSEKEISVRFTVSRQPVREAFIKLSEAGLVEIRPQRGTYVRKISARRVADGRFIREAVESAVVRRAANEITPQFLMRLDHNIEMQKLAAAQQDSQGFLQLDDEFHSLIAQSIDCTLAWETVENIKATMDRVRYLTLAEVSPPEELINEHQRILAAIKAGDADGAEGAIRRHLQTLIFSLTPIAERNDDWFEED